MRSALLIALTGVVVWSAPALAQHHDDLTCRHQDDDDWGESACVIREQSITPGNGPIRVNAHPNGGVTIIGWDRNEISLRTKIRSHARTDGRAKEILDQVKVEVAGTEIRASGPDAARREWWSVSFELRVPKRSALFVRAHNGGISVEAVEGEMDLATLNGGLSLTAVAGDVHAETTNGGVDVQLHGRQWSGRGLNVRTVNGGVDLSIPESYSAELETGTVNGGMDVDFPITVRGRLTRRLNATLGNGGPPIRVTTTNGGVTLHRAE